MTMLLDTHYHLDFVEDPQVRAMLVAKLAARKIEVVAQTLTPSSFLEQVSAASSSVGEESASASAAGLASTAGLAPTAGLASAARISLGFHPWWITSEEQAAAELALVPEAAKKTRFIGEIGLDFSERRLANTPADLQQRAFRELVGQVCAAAGEKTYVMSIHTVRSATPTLDILEQCGLGGSDGNARAGEAGAVVPVFHRFGGTSDELTRLIRIGGFISVHPRMLATKRGRAYAKQVPAERLLLESDLPSSPRRVDQHGSVFDEVAEKLAEELVEELAEELVTSLNSTVQTLSDLRGEDMAPIIERTQQTLYGMG